MQLSTDKMRAAKADGIGWITFNNPDRRNAISVEMRTALIEILEDFSTDDEVRVVVMNGAGDKAFVSGADISQFEARSNSEEIKLEHARISERSHRALVGLEKPLIAMIHGYCLGAGMSTALAADFRIASDDAQFGIPAARLGLAYPLHSIKALVDVVGPVHAKEMLMTARRYTAAEARGIGFLSRVVARTELEQTVREFAATMIDNAPLTLKASKVAIDELLKDAGACDTARYNALAAACAASEDHAEGRRAFMEKRKPRFSGR